MKKILIALSLILFSNIAFAEGFCELSKDTISEAEYKDCLNRELTTSTILVPFIHNLGEEAVDVVNLIFKKIVKKDIKIEKVDDNSISATSSESIQTNNFIKSIKKLSELVSDFSTKIYFVALCFIFATFLYRSAADGRAFKYESSFFLIFMIGFGIFAVVGGLQFIVMIMIVLSIMLTLIVWAVVSPFFYSFLAYDTDAIKTEFFSEAVSFADQYIESSYKAHISDIRTKNQLLFDNATDFDGYGFHLKDNVLLNCFNNPNNVLLDNKKTFISKYFIAGSDCSLDELDLQVYKMGHVFDKKDSDVSVPVIAKIFSMDDKVRQFAFKVHKNNCGSVNLLNYEKISEFLGVCADRPLDSNYTPNENGHIQEFKGVEIIDASEIKAEKEELKKELATFIYTEMLKVGNEVEKGKNNIGVENMSNIINFGLSYRKKFKAAGMQVVDINIVEDVVVKNNKFQEGISRISNIFTFGAATANDTFGIQEYTESLSVRQDFNKEIASIMNGISGNMFTNMGLQYEDCYSKMTCNSGESNIFITIKQTTSALMTLSFVGYVAFTGYGESKKRGANKINSYDKEAYALGQQISNWGKLFLIPIFLLLMLTLFIYRTIVLSLFVNLFYSLAAFMILPLLITFAIIIQVLNHVYKEDDRYSFADLLNKYGVWDAALRMPLVIISSILVLGLSMVFSSLIGIILFTVLSGSMNLYAPSGGSLVMFITSMIFLSIYVVSYIGIVAVSFTKSFVYTNSLIDDVLGGSVNLDSAIGEESNRMKSFIGKFK